MVMYDHTRNIAYQSKKLADLEKALEFTDSPSFVSETKKFTERLKNVLDTTFNYRRDKDHENALIEVREVINKLVKAQRDEAKADLHSLLNEEAR